MRGDEGAAATSQLACWRYFGKIHQVYETELVDGAASGEALFAYEWINPRFGKPVKEIRLRQTAPGNPITLAGVRVVKKRVVPEPKKLILPK